MQEQKKQEACKSLNWVFTAMHIVAIVVAMLGVAKQTYDLKSGRDTAHSLTLPVAMLVTLLCRLPSQVCVALDQKHGWTSVFGTIAGTGGYIYLIVATLESARKAPP